MPLQWQVIDLQDTSGASPLKLGTWIRTDRARVGGGWLVRSFLVKRDKTQASPSAPEDIEVNANVALTFVPDNGQPWPT